MPLQLVLKLCNENQVLIEFYPTCFYIKDLSSKKTLFKDDSENGVYKLQIGVIVGLQVDKDFPNSVIAFDSIIALSM